MLLKRVAILFFLWSSFVLVGALANEQAKIDSIREELPYVVDDSLLVDVYNEMAFHFGMISLDSCEYYLLKARTLAETIDYPKGLATNYSHYARVNIQKTEYVQAREDFDSALALFSMLKDSTHLLDTYMGLGYVYNYQSKKLHSLECQQQALPLAIALKDSVRLSMIYNNIAAFYYRMDDLDNASDYFKKSLDIEEALFVSSRDVALSYSNLGMLLIKQEKYDEATPLYRKLLGFLPDLDGLFIRPVIHMSLASYYIAMEDLDSSRIHLDKTDSLLFNTSYAQLSLRAEKRHADWCFLAQDYAKGIEHLERCVQLQQDYNIKEELAESYAMLGEAYYKTHDYEHAYLQMENYKEEIQSSENKQLSYFLLEFEEKQQAYELEQRRLSEYIRNQELEYATERLELRYYLAILLIFILISALILGALSWHKSRKNTQLLSQKNTLINQQKHLLESQIVTISTSENKLKQSNATKDKFMSIIAHDLRSPFNSLIGFSDLVVGKLENNDYDKVLDYSKLINQVARNSYDLLNNLLEWALQQAGKMSFSPEEIHINAFLDEMKQYFEQLMPERRIVIDSSLSAQQSFVVDKKMIHSVFRNLISNAFKYTPADGTIRLKAEVRDRSIVFAVVDNGIGMSAQQVDRLFKVENAESTRGLNNEKGTGLGLILCKDFVEKHQGHIYVESKEGQGSRFIFDIPIV